MVCFGEVVVDNLHGRIQQTQHLYDICPTSDQRRRRWSNVILWNAVTSLGENKVI